MKNTKHNPHALQICEGYFDEIYHDSYEQMHKHADNWQFYCTYQLLPNALNGHQKFLQLSTMQLSYVHRLGGMMNDSSTAKDCLTFAIIEESRGKACFDRMKLHTGDIVFLDDSRALNFMTSDVVKLSLVTMQKETMGDLLPLVTSVLYRTIKDTDAVMSQTLHAVWHHYVQTPPVNNKTPFADTEEKIKNVLRELLSAQVATTPKLTKGEEIALDIRDQVYRHMDGKINISTFAKHYKVTERTLQNSFKSLFGFAPNYFFRQLKLNLVHNELLKSDPQATTVSQIAHKWGFVHMGHFSQYYTELFGENPSQTLQKCHYEPTPLVEACVSRKEELF